MMMMMVYKTSGRGRRGAVIRVHLQIQQLRLLELDMMEAASKLVIPVSMILVLVAFSPTEAWYKQAPGPSYYSVGRASGLLSGIRRSPHVRRGEPADGGESAGDRVVSELLSHSSVLKTMVSALCLRKIHLVSSLRIWLHESARAQIQVCNISSGFYCFES